MSPYLVSKRVRNGHGDERACSEPEFGSFEMNNVLTASYPEIGAGGFSRIDGTMAFYQRVNALLTPSMSVLDLGAGRGAFLDDASLYRRALRTLKGKVREVIGADIDKAVLENSSLDSAVLCQPGESIPIATNAVDLLVSDFTFEHFEQPEFMAREIYRILKPGGWVCARTTNRYGYIGLFNRLIHSNWHHIVMGQLQPDRKHFDVFPAYYRLNTMRTLKRHFPDHLFKHATYMWDSEPRYFGNSAAMLKIFQGVQAITPAPLKTTLMIFMQKIGP